MSHGTAVQSTQPTSTPPPLSESERDMLAVAEAFGVNRTPLASGELAVAGPTCPKCTTPMQPTGSIGARGYYCPTPECTVANGPQHVLTYAPRGARGLVEDAVCGYTILVAQCTRCGLRADFGDPSEKQYHTMPGGCRP